MPGNLIIRNSHFSYDRTDPESRRDRNVATEHWEGTLPFSLALWPAMFLERTQETGFWYEHVNYEYAALEMVLDGEIIYEQQDEKATVRAGEIYMIHPGRSLMRNAGNPHYWKIVLIFQGGMLGSLTENLKLEHCLKVSPRDPDSFEMLFRRIGNLLARRLPESAPEVFSLSMECFSRLAAEFHAGSEPVPPLSLKKLLALIDANLQEHLPVSLLASEIGMSAGGLNKLFRKHLHCSVHDYVIRKRMTLARQLVQEGHLSLKETAGLLGFRDSLYFYAAFKKRFGCSPSVCRKHPLIVNRKS